MYIVFFSFYCNIKLLKSLNKIIINIKKLWSDDFGEK